MNFSKKNHNLVGQNEKGLRNPQKHDANLQKNTTLYFQVGLILALLLTYGLFEMDFQKQKIEIPEVAIVDNDTDIYVKDFKVYEKPISKEPKKDNAKSKMLTKDPIIVKNIGGDLPETPNILTPDTNTSGKSLDPRDVVVFTPEEDISLGLEFVEQVPIYPGCEKHKTNTARKKCMSDKIGRLVSKKFNTNIASELGLEGRQRINVMFKIDKNGNVSNIQATAKHQNLVNEAERVVQKIPKMKPGKQDGKEVSVLYALPILFQVHY